MRIQKAFWWCRARVLTAFSAEDPRIRKGLLYLFWASYFDQKYKNVWGYNFFVVGAKLVLYKAQQHIFVAINYTQDFLKFYTLVLKRTNHTNYHAINSFP